MPSALQRLLKASSLLHHHPRPVTTPHQRALTNSIFPARSTTLPTMQNSGESFDAIVIGAGIMGSCAAYYLAKSDRKTLLLEQFDFLHHRGSSHGESRTIRLTYPEPYYPPMVSESFDLWEQVQSEIGYRVLTKTTHFDMAPPGNKSFQSVISACNSNSIPYRILDTNQVSDHFSGVFHLPENWLGLITESGGIIKPTKAVSMFQALALKRGAVLKDREKVVELTRDPEKGGIWVGTESGKRFWSEKCVVTVGAWMSKLVREVTGLEIPIEPLQTTICYWKIKDGHLPEFLPENGFPTFACYGTPYVYGTPSSEFPGLVKVAIHGGRTCDPDSRVWVIDAGLLARVLSPWIEERFAGQVESGGPVLTQSCMYSMTPDGDFIVDFLGGEFGKDVVVAGGFSGHGFKMGPVIGRIVADLVMKGEAQGVEMRHFGLLRFKGNPKGNEKDFEEQASLYI